MSPVKIINTSDLERYELDMKENFTLLVLGGYDVKILIGMIEFSGSIVRIKPVTLKNDTTTNKLRTKI